MSNSCGGQFKSGAIQMLDLDLGVDGLVTDRPDIAATLLKDRGIRW